MAGREYAIDAASVVGGTDIDANATLRIPGSIVAGRLRVRVVPVGLTLVLPLTLRGITLSIPLHELHVRADVALEGLTNGSLGGWVLGDDLIPRNDPYGNDRGVIGALTDIQLNGVCDGSALRPPRYGGISMGLGIHGVPATIASGPGAIVSGPGVGTCGHTPPPGSDR